MIFTIKILDGTGNTLFLDLFHMDSITELYRRLSFLADSRSPNRKPGSHSICISEEQNYLIGTDFPNILEVHVAKNQVYEQIIKKQHEYINQNIP